MPSGGKITLAFLFLIIPFGAMAQENQSDYFRDRNGDTWHQLFLEIKGAELLEMKYLKDTVLIQGELASDCFSVVFRNYNGKGPVTLSIRDSTGHV